MTSTSEIATQYEFVPFEKIFLRRRDEIYQLVLITEYAFLSLNGTADLKDALGHTPESIKKAKEIEDIAAKETADDLPILHSAASVLIWGALEAAFRDFLIRWLVSHPSARVLPEFSNVRVRITEYESLEGEDRMRYLVGMLERELAATLKPGAGRFECLLKPFGIQPQISDEQRRDLSELAAVRNVIVHQAGIADERLVKLCPWLQIKVGDPVVIGRETFLRYMNATGSFAAALVKAADTVLQSSKSI